MAFDMFIVSLVLLLSLAPAILNKMTQASFPKVYAYLQTWPLSMVFSISSLNPIIYTLRNKELRFGVRSACLLNTLQVPKYKSDSFNKNRIFLTVSHVNTNIRMVQRTVGVVNLTLSKPFCFLSGHDVYLSKVREFLYMICIELNINF